ncbi:S49 family peptidase [Deinococcus maricopensis]|uniref:Peptidase S49 n=1 Tax=Deinococcus maricopensis (strain DSM 21211 / LMG 22137 / NRRL B-23946 / LB-34) TaxID=709986 RepID=E8U813_DEIML|nr:S49 family peptidase [Deinococcus maricopensis]ADV67202.1 peptidase S49 [Deinococcus maricopensis DSM 21211]
MSVFKNLPFSRSDDAPADLPKGVTRPTWVVVDVAGEYKLRGSGHPVQQLLSREDTLAAFEAKLEKLGNAPWLHGVLLRFGELTCGLVRARALARAIARLNEHKRTVAFVPHLNATTLLAASGAREITSPESAEVMLQGFAMETTYLGAFLKKHGVAFENVRIREFKAALTRFSDEGMDAHNREQLSALLAGTEAAWVEELARARRVPEDTVRGWLTDPVTSADGARARGLIDRVAYEDELVTPAVRTFAQTAQYLTAKPQAPRRAKGDGRVAVVSVEGSIVTGRSRNNPLPIPLVGGAMAGSDTVVAALRRAKADKATRAIVLYVDSPGGSALASDLIWREVQTSEKPVVAVMGAVAASGGYYVVAGAQRILASPYTITGSIGVVTGKPVLEAFNARHGLNPERVARQEHALMYSSSRPFSEGELALVERSIEEVYARFTARVAAGRKLSVARVDELGRGRIWSGQDALTHGLIDELGDLRAGVERACELAGLPYGSAVWHVDAPRGGKLPEFAREAAGVTFTPVLAELFRERTLLLSPHVVRVQ